MFLFPSKNKTKQKKRPHLVSYQQWIHHNWWIKLPWPLLSLPIWWPAEDWWAEHSRVREDTFFAHHHDGENLSKIFRLKSVFLLFSRSPLLNDGMENGEWVLILTYKFLGRSRIICRLSIFCVVFCGLIYSRHQNYKLSLLFVWNFIFEFSLRLPSFFS